MKNTKPVHRYHQMNSGGFYTPMPQIMPEDGFVIGGDIFIHADSDSEADEIAESVGIYFDGVSTGRDCSCCGDRWSRTCGALKEDDLSWHLQAASDKIEFFEENK